MTFEFIEMLCNCNSEKEKEKKTLEKHSSDENHNKYADYLFVYTVNPFAFLSKFCKIISNDDTRKLFSTPVASVTLLWKTAQMSNQPYFKSENIPRGY